jgi:hypothetical protein
MSTDTNSTNHEHQRRKVKYVGSASAPVYGIGIIGSITFNMPPHFGLACWVSSKP